jgi:hypothetical protein
LITRARARKLSLSAKAKIDLKLQIKQIKGLTDCQHIFAINKTFSTKIKSRTYFPTLIGENKKTVDKNVVFFNYNSAPEFVKMKSE